MQIIELEPKEVNIGTRTIAIVTELRLRNIVVRALNKWAQVYHDLYDQDGDLIASRDIKIEGDVYANWGYDDEYLVDVILSAYGLKRKIQESTGGEPADDGTTEDTTTTTDEPADDGTTEDTTTDGTIDNWVEPDGTNPSYNTGDKVKHLQKTWESTTDNNITEPADTNTAWNEITV